jgi:hypothetical protein
MIDKTMNAEEPKRKEGTSATAIIREDSSSEKLEQINDDVLLMTVLASSEFLVNIVLFLVDPKAPTTLCSLSTVSKSFCEAMSSNSFWEDMVHGRWGRRWDADLNERFFSGEQLQAGFWKAFFIETKDREDAEARIMRLDPYLLSQLHEFIDVLNLNEILEMGDY